jgi:hypothetical protein
MAKLPHSRLFRRQEGVSRQYRPPDEGHEIDGEAWMMVDARGTENTGFGAYPPTGAELQRAIDDDGPNRLARARTRPTMK